MLSIDGCVRVWWDWGLSGRSKAGEKGHGAQRRFAEETFLNNQALEACQASREDYANVLADLGFLPREVVRCVPLPSPSPSRPTYLSRDTLSSPTHFSNSLADKNCRCGSKARLNLSIPVSKFHSTTKKLCGRNCVAEQLHPSPHLPHNSATNARAVVRRTMHLTVMRSVAQAGEPTSSG